MSEWVDDFGTRVFGVHSKGACAGEHCTIHNPSDHVMKDFKQLWRYDRGIMERVCTHGVGHPDPDETALKGPNGWAEAVHGCDGCCVDTVYDFPTGEDFLAWLNSQDKVIKERRERGH